MPYRLLVSLLLLLVALAATVPLLRKLEPAVGRLGPAARSDSTEPSAPPSSPRRPERITVPHAVKVYRWRDASGTVHYESRPPPPDVAAEVIEMVGRKEVVVPPPARPGAGGPAPRREPAPRPLTVYSGEGLDQLMRRLDETLDTLEERRRTMDDLERQL